jgi:hypothetical protein
MSHFTPVNAIGRSFSGHFDFPRGVISVNGTDVPLRATSEYPNVPPGDDDLTIMERWYNPAGFGDPLMPQGWPTMYEKAPGGGPTPPEEEDPDPPFIDLILDRDRDIVINHTARLSGAMVELILNGTFQSRIKVAAHPLMTETGGPVSQVDLNTPTWTTIVPGSNGPNAWFLINPTNLIYTLRLEIPSAANPYPFDEPGIYRLLIDWEIRHLRAGESVYHYEALGGFDHNLVFRLGFPTE